MELQYKQLLTKYLTGKAKVTNNGKKFKNKQKRYSKNFEKFYDKILYMIQTNLNDEILYYRNIS